MHRMSPVSRPLPAILLALAAALALPLSAMAQGVDASLRTVFLVRHAEKSPAPGKDPVLSDVGQERARRLATLLRDAGIGTVFTSEYRRTRQTALPLAQHLKLDTRILQANLDAKDPYRLSAAGARQVRRQIADAPPGNVLVVGHGNTVTAILEALGAKAQPRISEAEFDRLYVVTVRRGKPISVAVLRY